MKLELTKKEIKLIQKALLNRKMGKDEQRTWESISEKIEEAEKLNQPLFKNIKSDTYYAI